MRRVLQRSAPQLAMLLLAACARTPAPATGGADSSLVASLSRGPCRGFCPVYRVDVYGDGAVRFAGEQNVRQAGAQTSSVSAERVQRLEQAIARSGFASMDTAFVYGNAACGQYYTDMPVVTLAARVGGRMKTVRHDPGCRGAPASLRTLEAQVDSIAGTAVWITGTAGSR
jgi:hypothetical protein